MIIESYTRIKRKIIVEVSLFLQAEGIVLQNCDIRSKLSHIK